MNRHRVPLMILMIGLFTTVHQMAGVAWAGVPDSDREEQWEFYLPLSYVSSEEFGSEGGTSVELHSDMSFGFGFGYNFNERFIVGFELTFMDMNFDASIAVDDMPMGGDGVVDSFDQVSGTLDASTAQITVKYNILERAVTPFIRAGLGSTYVDTNIATGQLSGSCWWHPYWGYICTTWLETYDDTSFSYGGGIGVRGEMTDRFYLEFSFNKLWIDADVGDNPDFSAYRLQVGWMF